MQRQFLLVFICYLLVGLIAKAAHLSSSKDKKKSLIQDRKSYVKTDTHQKKQSLLENGDTSFFDTNIDLIRQIIRDHELSSKEVASSTVRADAYRKLGNTRGYTDVHNDDNLFCAIIDSTVITHLALLLQAKDARQHSGGVLQAEALVAFDNAIEYASHEDSLVNDEIIISSKFHKGITLKMMGFGHRALACYDSLLTSFPNLHESDLNSIYTNRADAYVMLHMLDEAMHNYNLSLSAMPCKLSNYLPIVEIYKEINTMSQDDWIEYLATIRNIKRSCDLGQISTKSVGDRKAILNGGMDLKSDGSGIYFALHLAAEKSKMFQFAWDYLLKAHEVELSQRDDTFDPYSATTQRDQIVQIFTKNFWPANIGYKSSSPAFIIGMMRYDTSAVICQPLDFLLTILTSFIRIYSDLDRHC